MSRFGEFFARGRSALLDGQATYDRPPVEGARRWGAAAVLRPSGAVLDRLAKLAGELRPVVGPGHWVHGPDVLHVTLRSLEPYREDVTERRVYGAALEEAMRGLPPVRVELRGVAGHHGGVLVWATPADETLATLQKRFAHALGEKGAFESWTRDIWYVSLVHFAAPVVRPEGIVGWCEERADLTVGVAELSRAEIVRAVHTGGGVRLVTLERAECGP
ncbi:2'-5' RNA ligase family protein [Nonomuraea dietziae]|uniref:2'-5' RNA ligase family protein n=1 Tax=Nonomuraea dietziae TaxID=65515 RepID=UPI00344506E6